MQNGRREGNPRLDHLERLSRLEISPGQGCCTGRPMGRRQFIRIAGAAAAAASIVAHQRRAFAGPFDAKDLVDHFVPADKKLDAQWLAALTERGASAVYSGTDLETIGMPVGGMCAGQIYLTGDGQLAHWDLFNLPTGGYGYPDKPVAPTAAVDHGFAVRVRTGERRLVRRLNAEGFPAVEFCGEYPLATVSYHDKALPITVTLEAFSPFIPLNAPDSALPATLMQYTVKNTSPQAVEVDLAGWLENAVCRRSSGQHSGDFVNRIVRQPKSTTILSSARKSARQLQERPTIVLADFEGKDYGPWKAEGEAFGTGPAGGTLAGQQKVSGFEGKGLVNTFLGGDKPRGKLLSPAFKIERAFLSLLIGGGSAAGATCINLVVDGEVVRTAVGADREQLKWHNWNVAALEGKEARIEIVDASSGPWGHINIDQVELRDRPRSELSGPLEKMPDYGTLGLSLLAPKGEILTSASLPAGAMPDGLFDGDRLAESGAAEAPFGSLLRGAVGESFTLQPGEQRQVSFAVTWHFANLDQNGQFYATRFQDAGQVARYLGENLDRLAGETRRWHATYYDSTLPHWLLDRLHSTVSTLATSTCQWWANGRFWAFEGVRCCHGTCGHVWNYEHAMARLFPSLERSVREMQDFNADAGFEAATGRIRFRGNWPDFWCGDAQTGYILKAWREHQVSADDAFLRRNWSAVRKAIEYLFLQDANDDGLIEGEQHNTYDINFYGPNPMIGSLYLGALRAGEELARELGENDFADKCRKVFQSGSKLSVERLFNGDYLVQIVDLARHPKHQHGDGCLSDQLFGQGWAHQVGLGYVYPENVVRSGLQSIWKYNWAPDIQAQNEAHPPQRWFAYNGEAGLFTCTWPKSKHLGPESVLYRDEVWTGIEYQVAGHMAWEGMVTEALAICRGVHERYHPAKHNPFNEIECGDHYARGMASWGVLLGLCRFEYHGPRAHLGFTPRLGADDFRAAFTAAEGWGTLAQIRSGSDQTERIEVKWGKVPVKSVALELPEGLSLKQASVKLGVNAVAASAVQEGPRVVVTLEKVVVLAEGESLEILLQA
ncbi:MAG: GH116 family glycosyl hydrolase [Thermoguttaceae bacterium]